MADEIATLISSVGLTQETFLVFCVIIVNVQLIWVSSSVG